MKEALYYQKLEQGKVCCLLCPRKCVIASGKYGFCRVRKNIDGKLFSENYGRVSSIALDPIEKKPLYHFHPGKSILSLGTKGCNLSCLFCQNWQISQADDVDTRPISLEEIINQAKKVNSFGIAYTYNEPLTWYEFILQSARFAGKKGLKNVLVTNGFINQEPLKELIPYIDALNIDLKSIDDNFYVKYCGGTLKPVLETIKTASRFAHLELTNLIIPTLNDSRENFIKLRDWIFENLGPGVPLHFSGYFPCYKMDIPPTPLKTLEMAREIALEKLRYVYLGNV
ncbi:MAG: AmmeMemoRadiSam system radical SAM enzyme [Candidatus Omnitrophota bacterium]|nr:AmmeMemoRadiSam system radical SAM enzyme [Candidatus Omnitrophota bacterium]